MIVNIVNFRDNLTIKYGKGYAMTETTLLICDLSDGATTKEQLAKKRKRVRFFLLYMYHYVQSYQNLQNKHCFFCTLLFVKFVLSKSWYLCYISIFVLTSISY